MKVLSPVCGRGGRDIEKMTHFWGQKDPFDEVGIQNFHLFFKKLIWQFCSSMSKWNFGGKMKVLSLVCVSVGQEYLKNDPFWGKTGTHAPTPTHK